MLRRVAQGATQRTLEKDDLPLVAVEPLLRNVVHADDVGLLASLEDDQ